MREKKRGEKIQVGVRECHIMVRRKKKGVHRKVDRCMAEKRRE